MWCDTYRPQSLDQLTYHNDLSETLTKLATVGEFPHLLFYGVSGAGKKTRISALLREVYGPGVSKGRTTTKPYKVNATKSIDLTVLSSPYHVEMNPSDAGIYDRIIVQEVIKNMASVHSMNSKSKHRFKVVVLEEVGKLTKSAQHALRRTMEKYMQNCRLILCCESVSKIIDPLRSRCLAVRVPAPTHQQIVTVLTDVAAKENKKIPPKLALKIAQSSSRNLRRALLMLQVSVCQQDELKENQIVKQLPWEMFLKEICDEISKEQKPSVLNNARLKLYELSVNCIPPTLILRRMCQRLMQNVDDSLRHRIAYWAAFHEGRMQNCDKKMPHLVAFVSRFMHIHKEWADSWFN